MRISITYDVDKEIVDKCSEITGLEASVDREGTGEILIGFSKVKPGDKTVLIQTASAGVDHIDFSSIGEGITVCSNAGAYSGILGEMVFALLLSHAKKITQYDGETRKGIFKREAIGSLEGKTFGILGYGGIGRQSARIAKAMDMRTTAYSRSRREDQYLDGWAGTPDELFESSDIILISTPLNGQTEGMVNESLLSRFRGKYIINVARAEVVDREDMLRFLSENSDKYYLTDVWWGEPEIKYPVPENAMLTPHVGGFARETLPRVTIRACENVKRFLEGDPENVVDPDDYIRK